VAFAANWTFDDTWMTFFRAGWSEGSAPIFNRSLTAGLIRKFYYRSDTAAIGFNWGDPPDDSLPDQKTLEAFWNIQFAQNFTISPGVQLLVDPALNPDEDQIWIAGLRTRLTF
jgi:porin